MEEKIGKKLKLKDLNQYRQNGPPAIQEEVVSGLLSSVLGPVAFNVFIRDLDEEIDLTENKKYNCTDVCLLSQTPKALTQNGAAPSSLWSNTFPKALFLRKHANFTYIWVCFLTPEIYLETPRVPWGKLFCHNELRSLVPMFRLRYCEDPPLEHHCMVLSPSRGEVKPLGRRSSQWDEPAAVERGMHWQFLRTKVSWCVNPMPAAL
uniref:uncharacterized protein n=1 Tax=Lonchura striata TaxID=40157 RepID=UPI001293A9D5|nr:uncharacterized protein LOC116183450 [Lonchura striata domestica]